MEYSTSVEWVWLKETSRRFLDFLISKCIKLITMGMTFNPKKDWAILVAGKTGGGGGGGGGGALGPPPWDLGRG